MVFMSGLHVTRNISLAEKSLEQSEHFRLFSLVWIHLCSIEPLLPHRCHIQKYGLYHESSWNDDLGNIRCWMFQRNWNNCTLWIWFSTGFLREVSATIRLNRNPNVYLFTFFPIIVWHLFFVIQLNKICLVYLLSFNRGCCKQFIIDTTS